MNVPKASKSYAERNRMAVAFIESSCYKGNELDKSLVKLIRAGFAIFQQPDLFQITEEGMEETKRAYANA